MLKLAFSLLILCSVGAINEECPVSNAVDRYNTTNYFYYPLDIYAPAVVSNKESGDALPCSANDDVRCNRKNCHLCPKLKSFCPVASQNIELATRRSSRLTRSSLCILNERLLNPKSSVNFYVSGGSVTIGSHARGCCPHPDCNPQDESWPAIPCKWNYRFYEWMKATYPAQTRFISLANHGRTSMFMADVLQTTIKRSYLQPFTSDDVIFLDHSVNDSGDGTEAEHALELLIRRFYHFSKPYSLPTIIIIDADPNPRRGKDRGPYPYFDAYEKVGRHYNIPFWSYRDSVVSNFSRSNQSQYNKYLDFTRNADHDTHPSWHVHLFIADMFASLYRHETQELCDLSVAENREMFAVNVKLRNKTMAELPAPLSVQASLMCDKELLSLSYDIVKENLHPVGSYRFEPDTGGWILGHDKAGRAGGFLASNTSSDGSRVVFTLNTTTIDLIDQRVKFQIVIHYLRSYENAGMVRVTMCNQDIPHGDKHQVLLDGLWADRKYRYSLPDKWSSAPTLMYGQCRNFPEKYPTVEVHFYPNNTLERGNQKFKLMNIKVCRVSD